MAQELRTLQGHSYIAYATNSTDTSFPAPTGTTTKPTAGVLPLLAGESNNSLVVLPYGVGASNTTFDLRVMGWMRYGGFYVPFEIVTASCTLGDGTASGLSGQPITDTDFFCDTVAFSSGSTMTDLSSPGSERIGWFQCQTKGAALVQIQIDLTGATSANALVGVI